MKIDISFATEEDSKHFYNVILLEKNKIHRQLGVFGINLSEFKGDQYNSSFIAKAEGEIVAFAKVNGGDLSGFNYIGLFYVLPKYRKQRVGTQLFKFVEEYAFNNWVARGIELFTIDNQLMDLLVKKQGYKLSGVYKNKYCINGKYYNQTRWMKMYKT